MNKGWLDRIPELLAVIVPIAALHPLARGQMPLTQDHPVHLFKAWQFWEQLWTHGTLRGWSHAWFFGYPAGELYPLGTDVWVALARIATFGQLSWEATYAVGFLGFFVALSWSVYKLGAHWFGPWAGLVAALAIVLDQGGSRAGGWHYTVMLGVWGQPLALIFFLHGLRWLDEAITQGEGRELALGSVAFGLALLGHQAMALLLALVMPLYALARWQVEGRSLIEVVREQATSIALAVCVAGFWFLPMIARSTSTSYDGSGGRGLGDVLWQTLQGRPLDGLEPFVTLMAVVGAVLGIRARRYDVVFLALSAGSMLLLASSTVYETLASVHPVFGKVQWQRLAMPAKVWWVLLAGFGVVEAIRLTWTSRSNRVLLVVCGLVASGGAFTLGREVLEQAALTTYILVVPERAPNWKAWQRFQWQLNKKKDGPFFRVALDVPRHEHSLMALPVHTGIPVYKVGYTPAKLFAHVPETDEPELLKALSVRWIVRYKPDARYLKQRQIAGLWVHTLPDYTPDRWTVTSGSATVDGQIGDREMRLQLSDVTDNARLKLHVAHHDRWDATLNGEPVPIDLAPVFGDRYPFLMEVPIADGELVLRYVRRPIDHIGAAASWLGLVACLLLGWSRD